MLRSLRNIKIKAGKLWKVAALVAIAIIISCCATVVSSLDQPTTATVGKPIQISFTINYCSPESATANLVVAVLLPIGWQGSKNMTMTYSCSAVGNGTLKPMPSTTIEHQSGLPWPQALLNKFGIKNNYINNMQWVVFQSDNAYNMSAINTPVNVTLTLTPGADNNNAEVNMNYLVAETNDGLADPDTYLCSGDSYEYYAPINGTRLTLTGGAANTDVDYADPQYGTVVPGVALTDDYITVSFNGAATTTPTALLNQPQVYFHAIAYTTDGSTYIVNEQTSKTEMVETSSTSNTYKLTFWPRSFFGVPAGKTIDHMKYLFTDVTGTKQVGFNNTSTPFSFQFFCE
jgi:hypothetical protein